MVLTGIVVAVSATALALALACRIHKVSGSTQLADNEPE
jgi:multisubunit Na+/H+ antiporter MnhC subunit